MRITSSQWTAETTTASFAIIFARQTQTITTSTVRKFVNQKSGNLLAEWIHSGKPDATSMDEQSYLSAISIPRQTSETADAENNVLDITTILESNEIQLLQVIYQLE